jgi:hypothetical protein
MVGSAHARTRTRKRIRRGVLVTAAVLAACAVWVALTLRHDVESARAAGITCGTIALDHGSSRFTHSCHGKATLKYTVSCFLGQAFIVTHRWDSAGQSRSFSYSCGNFATSASYQIIG